METKMQMFLGGACDIYALPDCVNVDTAAVPSLAFGGIAYDERVVGSRRSFDAMQAGHTIQRVIRVPLVPRDLNDCFVVEAGKQYSILQAQKIMDTSPKCWQLTLEKPNIIWALEEAGG